jgi:hypothetical protein
MAEGVARMDQLYIAALASGNLVPDPGLIVIEPPPPVEEELETLAPVKATVPARVIQIQFLTRNDAGLASAFGSLRSIGGVEAVSPRSAAVGGWSILLVTYRGDPQGLATAMSARGWSVIDVGGTLRVDPRSAAPTQPPPPPPENTQQPAPGA